MKHQPVPVEGGQSSKDAAKAFLDDKGRSFKERSGESKKETEEKKESAIEKMNKTAMPDISKRGVKRNFGSGAFAGEMEKQAESIKAAHYKYIDDKTEENAQALLDEIEKFNAKAKQHFDEKKAKDEKTKAASDFEVVRETAKARQLRKDGKTFWIQKGWQREDGSLTPAGQKAFEEEMTDSEKQKAREDYKKQREEGIKRPAKADWESDKAYGYDINLSFYDSEKNRRHRIFVPKSIIQENGNIPTWFLEKKMQELEETYPYQRYGGFAIDSHPFEGAHLGKRDWSEVGAEWKETKNKTGNTSPLVYKIENSLVYSSKDNGETWGLAEE